MKLENQVCSLPLAQQLKELGVKQESLFAWARNRQTALPEPRVLYRPQLIDWNSDPITGAPAFQYDDLASAFTVAELGEMMKYANTVTSYWGNRDARWCWIAQTTYDEVVADTEADARAKMLIYLLENNLITL